ncbi:MAG: hemolysin, partial [Pseudomonadota bacterium]
MTASTSSSGDAATEDDTPAVFGAMLGMAAITVVGDGSDETLTGSEDADLLQGLGGDDLLEGLGGNDEL